MNDWTKQEYDRLMKSVQYLIDEGMTFDNRKDAYENYGKVISILKNKDYPKYSELAHTFTKEVEFARGAGSKNEFSKPYISSYTVLVPSEMISVKCWLEERVLPIV